MIIQSVVRQKQIDSFVSEVFQSYNAQTTEKGKQNVLAQYVEKVEYFREHKPILNVKIDLLKSFADENIGIDEDGPTYEEWCEWLSEQGNSVAWHIFVASGCDL